MQKNKKLNNIFLSAILFLICLIFSLGIFYFNSTSKQITFADTFTQEFAMSGEGDETSPYIIRTPSELSYVAQQVNKGGNWQNKHFQLGSDIDLSGRIWTPIGTETNSFQGMFNGRGYTIKNLYIDDTITVGSLGLFGTLENAKVYDLRLVDATIVSQKNNVGLVAGKSVDSTISACYVIGFANSTKSNEGSVVGYLDNSNLSRIETNTNLSRIAGYSKNGKISNCLINANSSILADSTTVISDCVVKNDAYNYINGTTEETNLSLDEVYSKLQASTTAVSEQNFFAWANNPGTLVIRGVNNAFVDARSYYSNYDIRNDGEEFSEDYKTQAVGALYSNFACTNVYSEKFFNLGDGVNYLYAKPYMNNSTRGYAWYGYKFSDGNQNTSKTIYNPSLNIVGEESPEDLAKITVFNSVTGEQLENVSGEQGTIDLNGRQGYYVMQMAYTENLPKYSITINSYDISAEIYSGCLTKSVSYTRFENYLGISKEIQNADLLELGGGDNFGRYNVQTSDNSRHFIQKLYLREGDTFNSLTHTGAENGFYVAYVYIDGVEVSPTYSFSTSEVVIDFADFVITKDVSIDIVYTNMAKVNFKTADEKIGSVQYPEGFSYWVIANETSMYFTSTNLTSYKSIVENYQNLNYYLTNKNSDCPDINFASEELKKEYLHLGWINKDFGDNAYTPKIIISPNSRTETENYDNEVYLNGKKFSETEGAKYDADLSAYEGFGYSEYDAYEEILNEFANPDPNGVNGFRNITLYSVLELNTSDVFLDTNDIYINNELAIVDDLEFVITFIHNGIEYTLKSFDAYLLGVPYGEKVEFKISYKTNILSGKFAYKIYDSDLFLTEVEKIETVEAGINTILPINEDETTGFITDQAIHDPQIDGKNRVLKNIEISWGEDSMNLSDFYLDIIHEKSDISWLDNYQEVLEDLSIDCKIKGQTFTINADYIGKVYSGLASNGGEQDISVSEYGDYYIIRYRLAVPYGEKVTLSNISLSEGYHIKNVAVLSGDANVLLDGTDYIIEPIKSEHKIELTLARNELYANWGYDLLDGVDNRYENEAEMPSVNLSVQNERGVITYSYSGSIKNLQSQEKVLLKTGYTIGLSIDNQVAYYVASINCPEYLAFEEPYNACDLQNLVLNEHHEGETTPISIIFNLDFTVYTVTFVPKIIPEWYEDFPLSANVNVTYYDYTGSYDRNKTYPNISQSFEITGYYKEQHLRSFVQGGLYPYSCTFSLFDENGKQVWGKREFKNETITFEVSVKQFSVIFYGSDYNNYYGSWTTNTNNGDIASDGAVTYVSGSVSYKTYKTNSTYYYKTFEVTAPEIERSGYIFMGWSTSNTATTPEFTGRQVSIKKINRDYRLYPVWESEVFYISYNNNPEGLTLANLSTNPGVTEIGSGETYEFPEITSSSHALVRWEYVYDGVAYSALPGDTITWDYHQDMTFNAVWEEGAFEITTIILKATLNSNYDVDLSEYLRFTKPAPYGKDIQNYVKLLNFDDGFTRVGFATSMPVADVEVLTQLDDNVNGLVTEDTTIYVVYKNYYILSFQSDDESKGQLELRVDNVVRSSPILATYGEVYSFTRKLEYGYEIGGVLVEPIRYANCLKNEQNLTMPASDVNVTLYINAISINITYDANGGEFEQNVEYVSGDRTICYGTVTYGYNDYSYMVGNNLTSWDVINLEGMPTPTFIEEYDFAGWYIDVNVDSTKFTAEDIFDYEQQDGVYEIILKAKWVPHEQRVQFSYHQNGVEGIDPDYIHEIAVINLEGEEEWRYCEDEFSTFVVYYGEYIRLPYEIYSSSHNFEGWELNSYKFEITDDFILWEYGSEFSDLAILTAIWTPKTYDVSTKIYAETLDENRNVVYTFISDGENYIGQTGTFEETTFGIIDGIPSLDKNKPSQKGYVFAGFALDVPDGTNISTDFPFIDENTEKTIYLIYRNYYTLTLQSNNTSYGTLKAKVGNFELEDEFNVVYGEIITLLPSAEDGYVLEDYTYSFASSFPLTMPAEDVSITANFKAKQISLIYYVDQETFAIGKVTYNTNNYTYNSKSGMPIPTKTGYDFINWMDNERNVYTAETIWDKTYDETELYAYFEVKNFNIIINVYMEDVNSIDHTDFNNYAYLNFADAPKMTIKDVILEQSTNAYAYGEQLTLKIAERTGFKVQKIIIDSEKYVEEQQLFNFTLTDSDTTINVYLRRLDYTLTLNKNAHDASELLISSYTLNFGQTQMLPSTLTRKGYNLAGWNTKSNGSGQEYSNMTFTQGDASITLYAIWLENEYSFQVKVMSEKLDGTFEEKTSGAFDISYLTTELLEQTEFNQNIKFNTQITISNIEASYGFKFGKVTYNSALLESPYIVAVSTENVVEIYFERQTYNFSLNALKDIISNPSGYDFESQAYSISAKYESTFTLPELATTGFDFVGWNTEQLGTGKSYLAGESLTLTQDITLYAMWDVQSYNVQIEVLSESLAGDYETSQDATFDMPNQDKTSLHSYNQRLDYGAEVKLSNILINSGFTLDGVYIDEMQLNGNAGVYVFVVANADVVVKIKLTRKSYSLTLDANTNTQPEFVSNWNFVDKDGTYIANQTLKFEENITLPALEKEGYTFLGWKYGENTISSVTMPAENLILIAEWQIKTHKIRITVDGVNTIDFTKVGFEIFDSNNQQIIKSNGTKDTFETGLYAYGTTFTLNIIKDSDEYDYVVTGAETIESQTIRIPADNNLEIIIKFLHSTKSIKLDANGGTFEASSGWELSNNNSIAIITGDQGENIELLVPSRTGYTFTKYLYRGTNKEFSGTTFTISDSNLDLVAEWQVNSFVLTIEVYLENTDDQNYALQNFNSLSHIFESSNLVQSSNVDYKSTTTLEIKTNDGFKINEISGGEQVVLTNNAPIYSYKFVMPNDDATIIIKVERINFTLSLNKNTTDEVQGLTSNSITLKFEQIYTLPSLTRIGYNFEGWALQEGDVLYEGGEEFTQNLKDVTLYAKWSIKTHTLSITKYLNGNKTSEGGFTLNSFDIPTPTEQVYTFTSINYGTQLTLEAIEGIYEFVRFEANLQGTLTGSQLSFTMPDEDASISIYFVDRTYTLTLDATNNLDVEASIDFNNANGFVVNKNEATKSIKSNGTQILPGASSQGYVFEGWAEVKNGSVKYLEGEIFTQNTDKDITLYAIWKLDKYEINVIYNTQNAQNGNMEENEVGLSSCTIEVLENNVWVTAQTKIPYKTNVRISVQAKEGFKLSEISGISGQYNTQNGITYLSFVMPNSEVELQVNFERKTYQLSFKSGTTETVQNLPQNQTLRYEQNLDLTSLPTPTRTGYTFKAWSTEENGVEKETYSQGLGDEVLYATWQINTHTLTINIVGASPSDVGFELYKNETLVLASNSTDASYACGSYEFKSVLTLVIDEGIYNLTEVDGAEGDGLTRTITMGDQNKVVEINFGVVDYTFTLDASNENEISAYEVVWTNDDGWTKLGNTLKIELVSNQTLSSFPTPYIEGYVFEGWFDGTTEITEFTQSTSQEKTLKAKYSLNSYDLSLLINLEDIETTNFVSNDISAIKSGTLKLYVFNAQDNLWTNKTYNYGDSLNFDYKSDIRIMLELNNGFVVKNNNVTGGSLNTNDNTYTIEFKMPKNDHEVIVNIERQKFDLKFDNGTLDDVKNMPENIELKIQEVITLSQEPTRRGYTFTKWVKKDLTGQVIDEYALNSTFTQADAENTTLIAVWEAKTYVVQYDLDGGIGATSDVSINYDTEIPIPRVTKSGYTHLGWTLDAIEVSAGDTLRTIEQKANVNLIDQQTTFTLKAVWIANSHQMNVFAERYEQIYDEKGIEFDSTSPQITFTYFVDGIQVETLEATTGQKIKISAEIPEGYKVREWEIVNGTATTTPNLNECELKDFTSTITVKLLYEPKEFTLTLIDSENGTTKFVSGVFNEVGNTAQSLTGAYIKLEATQNDGYVFENINIEADITKGEPTTEILISDLTQNTTIQTTFIPRANMVTISGNNVEEIRYEISDSLTFTGNLNVYHNGFTVKTGQYLKVYAVAQKGYHITNILGEKMLVEHPISVDDALISQIKSDVEIKITTELNEYTLEAGVVNDEGGSVQVQTAPNGQDGKFKFGTSVTLLAQSEIIEELEKYTFIGWFEDFEGTIAYSTDNPLTLTVASDIKIYAKFEIKTFNVSFQIDVDSSKFGTIKGELQQIVAFGESSSQVTANAYAGYQLKEWAIKINDRTEYVSNSTVSVNNVMTDIVVTAYFENQDASILIGVMLDGEVPEGTEEVYIQHIQEEGTAKVLSLSIVAKTNTDVVIEATANLGYNLSVLNPYTKQGDIDVLIGETVDGKTRLTLNAKQAQTSVIINFERRENKVVSQVVIDGLNEGGIIRYISNGTYEHTGATYTTYVKTGNVLNYKLFVLPGYKLQTEFAGYVDNGTIAFENFKLTITKILEGGDFAGISEGYYKEAYDIQISDFKQDIEISYPYERLKTLLVLHGGNLADPDETFTAEILYGTKTIINSEKDLVPYDANYSFKGWANENNALMIDTTGKSLIKWVFDKEEYHLYAQWTQNLLQIIVDVEPLVALQHPDNLRTSLFSNSASHGVKPDVYVNGTNIIYMIRPNSNLYLTLPAYKNGYKFKGFYIKAPNGEYNLVQPQAEEYVYGTDYSTSTNCMLFLKTYDFYKYTDGTSDGSLCIKLVFEITTSIVAENLYSSNRVLEAGGSVNFKDATGQIQDGIQSLTTPSLTSVTMQAKANKGYCFVHWEDENGNIVSTQPEFSVDVMESHKYSAIFQGERIVVGSDFGDVVIINGNPEQYDGQIFYHVGDIINVIFTGAKIGYNHSGWKVLGDGKQIAELSQINGEYTLSDQYSVIKFNPEFVDREITVRIIVEGEKSGNGKIIFENNWNYKPTINQNVYNIKMPYFTDISFSVESNQRYKLDNISYSLDYTEKRMLTESPNAQLSSVDFENCSYIDFYVEFEEIYWRKLINEQNLIQQDDDGITYLDGDYFLGRGTEAEPYEINSIKDFAMVAFIINNNIKQTSNYKAEYRVAVYEVNQKIDFSERFWTPIGTVDNPFAGTFYIRGDRTGIFVSERDELYPLELFDTEAEYYLEYGKLFGYLTSDAKIIIEGPSLTVLWITLGSLAGLGVLFFLFIVIGNKKRKEVTQEQPMHEADLDKK